MSEHDVRMITLSSDDVDESIRFYSETLGMAVEFRDGARFAALDGGSVTLAVLAPIGRELGLLEIQIGAISTCTAIMFFFGGPFWGRRSEKLGRRPVMVIGFLGYDAPTIAFAQVVEWGLTGTVTLLLIYPLMILTRVAFAALSSGVFPAAQAFVTTTTKVEDRTSGSDLRARQQSSGPGQIPGFGPGRCHHEAQYPDGRASGLRAGRESQGDAALLPGRSGEDQGRDRSRGGPDRRSQKDLVTFESIVSGF